MLEKEDGTDLCADSGIGDAEEAIDRLTNLLDRGNLAEVEKLAHALASEAVARDDRRLSGIAHLAQTFVFWCWGTP